MSPRLCRALLFCLLLAPATVGATPEEDDDRQPQELKKLTLEELAQIDVTSASRRTERLSQVAAAVSVVRGEDVLRAGFTNLADAMRLGAGMDVARVNGNTWAISTRGFNITTANKLLVLVDGRSTYSPLFAGTFWDVQDITLHDLDRIEVIRGPGGSTWGANAVNGIINIISRTAAETQGSVVTLIAGTDEQPVVAARHGGRAGAGHYRVFGKYRRRGAQRLATGANANDAIALGLAGFRFDSDQTRPSRWLLSGAVYMGTMNFADRPQGDVSGGHVLGRWASRAGDNGLFQLRTYYDRSRRVVPRQFEETRHTGDVDAQHEFRTGRHSIVSGGQVQISRGRDIGSAGFFFDPETRTNWLVTAFAQDEIELARERAYLIGGAKIGANDYTGLEIQPTVRTRIHAGRRHVLWGAVSRAVRLPTRLDTDLRLKDAAGMVTLTGTERFTSESVIAYEAGYRAMPHARLTTDVAVFANRYDSLRSQEVRAMPEPRVFLENQLNAVATGIETAATFQAATPWRLHGTYAWLRKTFSRDPGSTDTTGGRSEGNDPRHLATLRSELDLPRRFSVDAFLRFVGRRPAPVVRAYSELDLRLGWRARPNWELSLVGQNLLHDRHPEFSAVVVTEFQRGVFLRSIWEF